MTGPTKLSGSSPSLISLGHHGTPPFIRLSEHELPLRLGVDAAKLHFDQYLPLNDMNGKALQAGAPGIHALAIRGVELPSVRGAG